MGAAAVPFVVLFGVATVLMVRSRMVRAWQAAVVFLFGFYLASTPLRYAVTAVVDWINSAVTGG